jgi:regulator of sirC expression with transglutaminase-like and TPR domain
MGSSTGSAAEAFQAALASTGGSNRLLEPSLAIGRIAFPDLDLTEARREFDALCDAVAHESPASAFEAAIAALNRSLFDVRGFRGNRQHYDDPLNSYLHLVVARRTGIPITLSILYIEIAVRLGLEMEGVGFPAHFLVRARDPEGQWWYLDPFNGGHRLSRNTLGVVLERQGGNPTSQLDIFLSAVTARQILSRQLNNLKAAYRNRAELALARRVVDLMLVLTPWDLDEVRDRGLFSAYLGDFAAAEHDLSIYVERARDASDLQTVQRHLREVRGRLKR